MEFNHIPVLLDECINGLKINPHGTYVDCTLGGGGHSFEISQRLDKDGLIIGIDKDNEAIAVSTFKLIFASCEKIIVKDDFKNYKSIVKTALSGKDEQQVDGVLIDLGVSSYQIDNPERGFSYRNNGTLDMRMDTSQPLNASTVVNTYSLEQLTKIFYEYGEEDYSKQIAKTIVTSRTVKPITTTLQLADVIKQSVPTQHAVKNNTVAKIFQAIRIEVNGELDKLENCLKDMIDSLKSGGRMCVISFHSLEDRIVKTVFKDASTGCICDKKLPICVCNHKPTIQLVTKKPIIPTEAEQKQNSRSVSAKLRIIQKI